MCQITRSENPLEVTEVLSTLSLDDNRAFTEDLANRREMRVYGKSYPDVRAMITDWLRKFGSQGFILVCMEGCDLNAQQYFFGRTTSGVLILVSKVFTTQNRQTMKQENRKQVLPIDILNVESRIAREIESWAMETSRKVAFISSMTFTAQNNSANRVSFGEIPPGAVKRGGQASCAASGSWEVIQYEPTRFKKSEEYLGGKSVKSELEYAW
ncbi:hypothetical protein BD410DRAFT_195375 [Rickenella mellea]|uniref:Uncharacterized protein n=1 Tax=Rickenella mellea TaxID=50990 RepID=A0A4Y7Q4Z6_9AGAM|nr:hypothetical protein BD410DRAFT_195375 [Rickenella mellea]